MGSSAPDINTDTNFNGYTPGSNPALDPMMGGSMNYGGTPIYMNNPAMFSPDQLNPTASPYVNNINSLQGDLQNSAAGGAFNPNFYQGMIDKSNASLTSNLGNQFAGMGLSGSSAEAGAMSNSLINNQMSWMNREQSDQMKSVSALEGLDQTGLKDTMAIQSQYGNFEDSYNQSIANLMGLQNQAQASNNQMWGSIIGGGTQAGGSMAAAALLA